LPNFSVRQYFDELALPEIAACHKRRGRRMSRARDPYHVAKRGRPSPKREAEINKAIAEQMVRDREAKARRTDPDPVEIAPFKWVDA